MARQPGGTGQGDVVTVPSQNGNPLDAVVSSASRSSTRAKWEIGTPSATSTVRPASIPPLQLLGGVHLRRLALGDLGVANEAVLGDHVGDHREGDPGDVLTSVRCSAARTVTADATLER